MEKDSITIVLQFSSPFALAFNKKWFQDICNYIVQANIYICVWCYMLKKTRVDRIVYSSNYFFYIIFFFYTKCIWTTEAKHGQV